MNIRKILPWLTTLSPEQKEALAVKFENGTLTDAERKDMLEHVFTAMRELNSEINAAKEILAALERLPSGGK